MITVNLDNIVNLLNSHGGRDKLIRTAYYALIFVTDQVKDETLAGKLLEVAKQLSTTRLISRQFGDILMLHANLKHWKQAPIAQDRVNFLLQAAVYAIYQVYHPVEHIAWLSTMDLVPANPNRWWPYTVMIWASALAVGIFKSLRTYIRLILRKTKDSKLSRAEICEIEREEKEELWSLLIQLSDLMIAVNYLPKGFLWSQTFPRWKIGAFGFIASFAGLLKLYRSLYNM